MAERITFEAELERHGSFLFTSSGTSMWPMIRPGKDLVEITRRPEERLKKYDVALYRRGSRYILHRVLRVRDGDYVIAGDHNYRREYGITDDQIIGVLSAVVRDGRRDDLTGLKYRLYTRLWCGLFPVRAAALWMAGGTRRAAGKAKRVLRREV